MPREPDQASPRLAEFRSPVRTALPARVHSHPAEPPKSPRPPPKPSVILIGASTGGPQALTTLLARLAPGLRNVPVCVAVHIPREFTTHLADQITRVSRIETRVVMQNTRMGGRTIFLAPGDKMLLFKRDRDGYEVCSQTMTAQDQCRTSVDGLFRSAAHMFGAGTLAVVLSGMGTDGLAGARAITAAGGTVLVQDAQTSAVWGMPGAIAKAGLAAAVLPPEALAFEIARRLAEPGSVRL